jgi:4-amino-4-deoxy-L-arabinose transferase-like glycosyltransferase
VLVTSAPGQPRATPAWFPAWIVLLALVGIAGRIAFYVSPFGVPDADEAVGGLMAKHELHGQFVGAFYWGQAYGGTLETWLAAPLLAIFGPSYVALRIVPIALSAVAALVVWRIGLRTMSKPAALTAAGLAWCFPSSLLWKTSHFHIFYASGMLLGLLTVLQALRMRERVSTKGMLLLGLVAGLGLWQSFQLATIVPPTLIWLAYRRRDLLRYWPQAGAGFLVGFAPVLASNLQHGWWSRDIGRPGDEIDYLHRVLQFFTNGLPIALDLRTPVTLHWLAWKPLAILVYAALLVGFVVLVAATRRNGRFSKLGLIATIAVAFPALYAISPLTSAPDIASYVTVFMPLIALLLCSWARDARQAAIVSAAALIVMAGSVTQLHADYSQSPRPDFSQLGTRAPLPRSFAPLITKLNELGIKRVYASYWIAFRIDFESNERIIAADMRPEALRTNAAGAVIPQPDDPLFNSRHPEYGTTVSRVQAPAFVFAKAFDPSSTDYGSFTSAGGYSTVQVGVFTIYLRGAASQGTGS